METERQYRWWQYNPHMTVKQRRLLNRLEGTLVVTAFGATASSGNLLSLALLPLAIDGIGDMITGEHLYLSSKVADYIWEKFH